jgi:hypothetical protein
MNRDRLVRAVFDAECDFLWAESSREEARKLGYRPEELAWLRTAFNRHMERRDWEWWKQRAERYSDAELTDQLQDAIDRTNALGLQQWRQETARPQNDPPARRPKPRR